MVKLRTVFGLPNNQDSKEGEAFDRELQEKRKQARIEQRELAEKTKIKQAKALKKEAMRREKERARAAKKAVKDAKKQEKQRQKVLKHSASTAAPQTAACTMPRHLQAYQNCDAAEISTVHTAIFSSMRFTILCSTCLNKVCSEGPLQCAGASAETTAKRTRAQAGKRARGESR